MAGAMGALACFAACGFARLGDGPLGPFPGGALRGMVARGAPDWTLVAARETVELQVDPARPRSVLTCILVHDGRLEPVDGPALHAALKAAAWEKYWSYEFGDGWAGRNLRFFAVTSAGSATPAPPAPPRSGDRVGAPGRGAPSRG